MKLAPLLVHEARAKCCPSEDWQCCAHVPTDGEPSRFFCPSYESVLPCHLTSPALWPSSQMRFFQFGLALSGALVGALVVILLGAFTVRLDNSYSLNPRRVMTHFQPAVGLYVAYALGIYSIPFLTTRYGSHSASLFPSLRLTICSTRTHSPRHCDSLPSTILLCYLLDCCRHHGRLRFSVHPILVGHPYTRLHYVRVVLFDLLLLSQSQRPENQSALPLHRNRRRPRILRPLSSRGPFPLLHVSIR